MNRPILAYSHADINFDDAIALLEGDPEGLLQVATQKSNARADEVVGRMHLRVGEFDIGRDVEIELGHFDPVEVSRSVLPLRWHASRGHLWFPTLDATLEIAALSTHPPRVEVTLAGSYRPPLGPLGAAMDAVATHAIVESTVQTFVDEVAERLGGVASELAKTTRKHAG